MNSKVHKTHGGHAELDAACDGRDQVKLGQSSEEVALATLFTITPRPIVVEQKVGKYADDDSDDIRRDERIGRAVPVLFQEVMCECEDTQVDDHAAGPDNAEAYESNVLSG